ncbi:MAG TPA: hypothetical protein VHM01_06690 [Alphaproteobacteria bacterium]|nr:hypothetical protein [Alphaproteobacteria bacterium]
MTVENDVADMYELFLRKGASEKTAREVAMAFYRQLMPSSDDLTAREAVSRAIATVRIADAAGNDPAAHHRRFKRTGG